MSRTKLWKVVQGFLIILFVIGLLTPTAMPAKAQSNNVDLYANATFGGLYVGVIYDPTISRAYLKLKITTSRTITFNSMGSDVCTNPTTGFQHSGQTFVFEGYVTDECDYNSISMGFIYQDGDEPVDVSILFQYNNSVWGETFYLGEVPVEVSVTPTTGRVGEEIIVPVRVDKLRGRSIVTLNTRVMFNYELYELVGYYPGSTWQKASINLVPNQPGDVTLGIRSDSDWLLSTDGVIVLLRFKALKAGSAPVVLWELALESRLGEEMPEVLARSAEVGVESYVLLTGQIVYTNTQFSVPGVIVDVNQSEVVSQTTDGSGHYSFKLPYQSSASPVFSKEGEDNSVSAFDAAIAERCALNMPKLGYPNECVVEVVDVTGDKKVTLIDSWYILRFSVGYRNESLAGQWRFSPGNVYYPQLTEDQTLNQTAWIIGDISGNWANTSVFTASVPLVTITAHSRRMVVKIEGATFYGIQFQVANNEPISINGASAEGFTVAPSSDGHTIGLTSGEARTSAEIVVDINAPIGTEIMVLNLKIDEFEPMGFAGSATVEERNILLSFLPSVVR